MADVFDESTLRAEIVKVWGEHGAHALVYDELLRRAAQPQGRVLWQSKTQTPSFGQIIPTPGYSDVIAPHVDVPPGTEVAVVVLSSRAEEETDG